VSDPEGSSTKEERDECRRLPGLHGGLVVISSEEMVEDRVRGSVSAVHVFCRVSTCVENRMPPPPAEERPGPMAYVVRFRL